MNHIDFETMVQHSLVALATLFALSGVLSIVVGWNGGNVVKIIVGAFAITLGYGCVLLKTLVEEL